VSAVIDFEIPRPWLLTSNQRLHWREKADRSSRLRLIGLVSGQRYLHKGKPMLTKQHCTVTIDWPDKRRRDAHNLMPTIKPIIDGLVSDAGLLPDDSDQFLVGPDLRVSDRLCDKRYAAVLHITFEPAK
jgi:hypothetical protein